MMTLMPEIHALTVCVGYHRHLVRTLLPWMRGCASITVVTSPDDTHTHRVCQLIQNSWREREGTPYPLSLFKTDAFTRYGAAFNKGLAINEAVKTVVPWEDWVLIYDCDICPAPGWRERLPPLQMGYLYGRHRLEAKDLGRVGDPSCPRVPDDRVGYGYFQLFHAKDPKVHQSRLYAEDYRHAGNSDSDFLLSFRSMVAEIPEPVWHLGGRHENWFGVGQEEAFRRMIQTRNGLGIHPSERLSSL